MNELDSKLSAIDEKMHRINELRADMEKIDFEELKSLVLHVTYIHLEQTTTTLCSLILINGMTITESSGCLNPNDYNEEMGQKIAYDRAINRLWELEGYARLRVHVDGLVRKEPTTFLGRMKKEWAELETKYDALNRFCASSGYDALSEDSKFLLSQQGEAMGAYLSVLGKRIESVAAVGS